MIPYRFLTIIEWALKIRMNPYICWHPQSENMFSIFFKTIYIHQKTSFFFHIHQSNMYSWEKRFFFSIYIKTIYINQKSFFFYFSIYIKTMYIYIWVHAYSPPLVFWTFCFLGVSGIYMNPYRILTILAWTLKKYMNLYKFSTCHFVTLPNGARGHFLLTFKQNLNNESIQRQIEVAKDPRNARGAWRFRMPSASSSFCSWLHSVCCVCSLLCLSDL